MKNTQIALLVALILHGCVTQVDMPELPDTHPANPNAEAGMLLEPSKLLSRHYAPPDTMPERDSTQHDHMQQRGHDMSGDGAMSGMEGEMKGMGHGGMEHGPHAGSDTAHDHSLENAGPVTGPMNGTARSGRIYRCPIHLGETSPYVGNCAKCGKPMAEQNTLNGDASVSEPMMGEGGSAGGGYSCTMHPRLKLSSPGLCPVCGMSLIAQEEGEQ